jgi:dTDP-4-amino-4,6-dideoxygalactose transaminase
MAERRSGRHAPVLDKRMKIAFVDLQRQHLSIRSEIDAAIDRVITTSSFILGPEVEAFEREFARFCGAKYALGVANGTDALYLGLWAAGIGPGDEVITAPNSYVSSALVVHLRGARPVFADIDPDSYNINPAEIERKITPRTRAIIPVHLFGQCARMDEIMRIARRHKLAVIEDACQAHGARFGDRMAGTFGDAGCFSFYPGKNLGALGDGGAIVTNSRKMFDRLSMLRNYGQREKYFHETVGINSRLDGLQAAVLRAKLRHLSRWVSARRKAANLYRKALRGIEQIVLPHEDPLGRHAYHIFLIRAQRRDELRAHLAKHGIATVLHYPIPIHLQEAYASWGYAAGDFPIAERYANEIVSLPIFPEIRPDEIGFVADAVRDFYSGRRSKTRS